MSEHWLGRIGETVHVIMNRPFDGSERTFWCGLVRSGSLFDEFSSGTSLPDVDGICADCMEGIDAAYSPAEDPTLGREPCGAAAPASTGGATPTCSKRAGHVGMHEGGGFNWRYGVAPVDWHSPTPTCGCPRCALVFEAAVEESPGKMVERVLAFVREMRSFPLTADAPRLFAVYRGDEHELDAVLWPDGCVVEATRADLDVDECDDCGEPEGRHHHGDGDPDYPHDALSDHAFSRTPHGGMRHPSLERFLELRSISREARIEWWEPERAPRCDAESAPINADYHVECARPAGHVGSHCGPGRARGDDRPEGTVIGLVEWSEGVRIEPLGAQEFYEKLENWLATQRTFGGILAVNSDAADRPSWLVRLADGEELVIWVTTTRADANDGRDPDPPGPETETCRSPSPVEAVVVDAVGVLGRILRLVRSKEDESPEELRRVLDLVEVVAGSVGAHLAPCRACAGTGAESKVTTWECVVCGTMVEPDKAWCWADEPGRVRHVERSPVCRANVAE